MVNNDAISGNYVMPQWPGYEEDCAAREPLRLYCDYASVARQQWKNVAIVSANNMAVHGIINLFKTLYPLCLQIFSDAKSLQYSLMVAKNFHPDIIIWIDARVQRLEGMSSLAIQISRRMPGVKQLMLSECIPSALTVRLRGVRVASLNTPISELTKIMKACLVPVERTGGLFSGRFMTPGQPKNAGGETADAQRVYSFCIDGKASRRAGCVSKHPDKRINKNNEGVPGPG